MAFGTFEKQYKPPPPKHGYTPPPPPPTSINTPGGMGFETSVNQPPGQPPPPVTGWEQGITGGFTYDQPSQPGQPQTSNVHSNALQQMLDRAEFKRNQSGSGGGGGGGGGSGDSFSSQVPYLQGQLNTGYLDKMRERGMQDPQHNPWMQYQMEREKQGTADARNNLASMGSSNVATQQGQMAMRGGLTSGATERIGQQNLMGQLMGNQQLSSDAAQREMAIRGGAEDRQDALLSQLGTSEMGAANYQSRIDEYNADQKMKDLLGLHNQKNLQDLGQGQDDAKGGSFGRDVSDAWKKSTISYDADDENAYTPWKRW